jgi:uncharacterized protein (DUF2062 family)
MDYVENRESGNPQYVIILLFATMISTKVPVPVDTWILRHITLVLQWEATYQLGLKLRA